MGNRPTQSRLRRAQRRMSRRQKTSKNREKAKRRLSRIHYRVSCQRKDTLHKLTTYIARSARTVVIEDLNVAGMVKNHNLARAISDCGFFEFRRQLEYKARNLIVADRFYPSSKLCNSCGTKNPDLKLSDRWWACACGAHHDRDLNAALNLASLARATRENTPVETGVPGRTYRLSRSRSSKQEPSREHLCSQFG
jgi:putative transposase